MPSNSDYKTKRMSSGYSYEEEQLFEIQAYAEELEETLEYLTNLLSSAMETLAETGQEDFVVLRNPEIGEWWAERRDYLIAQAESRMKKATEQVQADQRDLQQSQNELNKRLEELNKIRDKYGD